MKRKYLFFGKYSDIRKLKIGLSLSGGGALGGYHVGVLKYLEEVNANICSIAGSSIGAFVGALYAGGVMVDRMIEIAKDIDWYDVAKIKFSKYGLISNEKLGKILRNELGHNSFEKLKKKFFAVAVDIVKNKKIVFSSGELDKAVMGSSAIPGIFIPVEAEGMLLVDGGTLENMPISPLLDAKLNLDLLIGVDLNASPYLRRPENIVELVVNAIHLAIFKQNERDLKKLDIILQPDLSDYSPVDIDKLDELIEKGYSEAKNIFEKEFEIAKS